MRRPKFEEAASEIPSQAERLSRVDARDMNWARALIDHLMGTKKTNPLQTSQTQARVLDHDLTP